MTSPKLFAVGGAHIDRRGQMDADFVPGASIPGTMREDVGGGAFNALRTAIQRGVDASLMSVRGGDPSGRRVADAISGRGIRDASVVFLDRATPSYTALLDRSGDVVAALADTGLYDLAFPKQMRRAKVREEIAQADAILCDANLPAAAIDKLTSLAEGKPIHAIAISPAKVVRMANSLDRLSCLFLNRREVLALGGPTDEIVALLRKRGLKSAVVSNGAGEIVAFTSMRSWTIEPLEPRRVEDVTGAGDALAGATIAALMRGNPLPEAVREGIAAATLTIETRDSFAALNKADFAQALASVPKAREI